MIAAHEAWSGFAEAIADHPFATVESLLAEVQRGEAFVWYGERSAVFYRLDAPAVECGPAMGDVDEIMSEFRPWIEREAREAGFSEIHIQAGRQGWARMLRPFGYAEAAVILRKKLSDGNWVL